MKKSIIFGAALMCACTFGLQSCDKESNPAQPADPTVVVIDNGTELAEVIAKYNKGGEVTLPAGVELMVNGPLDIKEPLTIKCEGNVPATVTFATEDAGFIIGNGLTLDNIAFNCSASTAPFIQLSKTPTVEPVKLNAWNTDYNFYLIKDPIAITNCFIDGVNSFFLTDNKIEGNGVWFPSSILVDNCLVRLSTATNSSGNGYFHLNNGGGFAKEMTVKNSTFYNTTENGFRYFVRYGGFGNDQVKEDSVFGWKDNTLAYENCTFYNVCQNDGQWGNYNGIMGKKTSYWVMTNCIFWNCSTSGSVPRRFLHGKSNQATATFLNNTYMKADGTFQDPQNYDVSGTNIEEDPNFADPANGDFHISNSKQAELKTGDPRWLTAAAE